MNRFTLLAALSLFTATLSAQISISDIEPFLSSPTGYIDEDKSPDFTISRINAPYKAEWRHQKPWNGYFVRPRYGESNNLYAIDYFEKGARKLQYSNDPFLWLDSLNYNLVSSYRNNKIWEGYAYDGHFHSEGFEALFTEVWRQGHFTEMWLDVKSSRYATRINFMRSGDLFTIESMLDIEKSERTELEYAYDKWACRQYYRDTLAFVQQRGTLESPLGQARERIYAIEDGKVEVFETTYINRELMAKMSQNIISRLLIYPAILTTPDCAFNDIRNALINDNKEAVDEPQRGLPQFLFIDDQAQWQGRFITSTDHKHYTLVEYSDGEIVHQFEQLTYDALVQQIKKLDYTYLDEE